jgi:thioredoxin:protein disulfide reductase
MSMDTHSSTGRVRRTWITLGLALLWLCWSGLVQAANAFLEPEQAFRLSAQAKDERTVEVRFDVAPGYYLYRERLSVQAPDGVILGEPVIPPGKVKFDENFQKDVETYHGGLSFTVPVTQAAGPFTLTVNSQGCADAGLCYPPQTQMLRVSLRAWGGDGAVVLADATASSSMLGAAAPTSMGQTAVATQWNRC